MYIILSHYNCETVSIFTKFASISAPFSSKIVYLCYEKFNRPAENCM